MNRDEALIDAWDSFMGPSDDLDIKTPHPMFSAAFNAGWDALLAEIKPLVADLRSYQELKRVDASNIVDHRMAIDRLRELTVSNG